MEVRNFYRPDANYVDWTKKLNEIYSRQSEQLKEYHDNLTKRDQQMVAKAGAEDITKFFSGLATLSGSVAKAVEASKTAKDKKSSKYKKSLSTSEFWVKHSKEIDRQRELKYKKDKNELEQTELDTLTTNLFKIGKDAAALDILNASGRRLVWQNELLAQNAITGFSHVTMRKDFIDNDRTEELEEYESNIDNPDYIEGMFIGWQREKLSHLNLNETAISGILGGELRRQRETVRGTTKASSSAAVADKEDLRIKTQLETANNVGGLEGSIWDVREDLIKSGRFQPYKGSDGNIVTANRQVDDYLYETLNDLATDSFINVSQLEPYLQSGFRHPAGKGGESTPGEILFSKEQVNQLIKSARLGEERYIGLQTARDTKKLEELKQKKQLNTFTAKDSDELDKISHRGLLPDQTVENVRDMKPQTADFYVKENEHFESSKVNGTFLTKDNISRAKKNDSNIAKEQEAVLTSQKANQFPNFETRRKVNDNIISQDSKKRTLGDGEVLGENTFKGQLSAEMTRLEDLLYMKYYKLNPDDTDIATRVAADMARIKQEKGFGKAVGETGSGVWSKDSNGDYPNFVRTKVGEIDIKDNRTSWSGSVVDAWGQTKDLNIPGETRTEKLLNIPNSILTPDKILDNLQNGITPELLYKATMIPGKNETEVLQAIGEALLNNPDQKDFVQKNNIKKLLDNIPTAQISLKELVEKSNDADLKAIDRNLANASPKQLKRYHDKLLIIEGQGEEDKQQALQKKKEADDQKAKERKEELERKRNDIIREQERDKKRDEFIDSSAGLSSAIQQGANLINNVSPSNDFIQ